MDSVLDDLPADYFRSNQAQFSKSHRRSSNKSRRTLKKKSNKMNESEKRKCSWIICMVNSINILVILILVITFLYRKYANTNTVSCPFGFVGDSCQREDYIDAITWSSSYPFEAADGTCTNGYSFRMWAPGAYGVRLCFKNPNDSVFSYYPMKEQDNGFWFVLVCNCLAGAEYKYVVDYHSSQDGYSLSLGSLERTPLKNEISNILIDTNQYNVSLSYVPVPSKPIIYQIHLPTYISQKNNPYTTLLQRVQTFALAGINTIELNGLEFLNCDSNKELCWDESSYSPGLLRPSLTNTSSLIDLVHNLHMNDLSVIIDLNWESFKKSTIFGSYHTYYTKYIEKNFNSSSEIKDIFREIQYCKNEKCPLEMKNSDVNVLVLYSVLQRYRTFFRIDGIRWIVNECNQYVGGDCSSTNQESIQYDYDFWNLIKELGFTIITSKPSSVPSYDYYLDTSLCSLINTVQISSPLHPVLKQMIQTANSSSSNTLLTLECMNDLPKRLYSRNGYKITSMLLSFFYLLPTHLHFFMGTVYMSEVSFDKNPSVLDIDSVGIYKDGSWFAPSNKYLKFQMTLAINRIRQDYLSSNELELLTDDEEKQVMAIKVGNTTNPLLVIINYSRTSYSSSSDVYNLTIPSIHPSYDQGRWRFIYSTANNNYDVDTVSIGSDLTYNECNDNVNIQIDVCYKVLIGDQALNVYEPILEYEYLLKTNNRKT